ncbi:MAG: hypothetical protein U1E65_18700 [Myxococcota bacterium]
MRNGSRRVLLVVAGLGLGSVGCGDIGNGKTIFKDAELLVRTDAVLSASSVAAGVKVAVSCMGHYADGHVQPLTADQATFQAAPAEGIERVESSLIGKTAGSYEVTCPVPGVEAAPSTFVVTPADAARLVATVAPGTIAVGESASVHCFAEDAYGNLRSGDVATITSGPGQGTMVLGDQVRGTTPGDYEVRCALGNLASEPAPLHVVNGTPVSLSASLDRYEVRAGEYVTVYCLALDVGGNRVPVNAEIHSDLVPASTDATGIVPAVAAPHHLTCVLPDVNLSSDPVELTVRPGLPAEIHVLGVLPAAPVYARNTQVELTVRMLDHWMNEVPAATVGVTAVPAIAALSAGSGKAILIGNGSIDLVATVTSPTYDNATVADTTTVMVDGSPPEIVVDFPSRAEIVTAAPGAPLTIRGHVTDALTSVSSLAINGNMVAVGAGGAFTATMNTAWGINLIEATAVDAVGNTRALAQSFELASRYRRASAANVAAGRISDGIMAHLGAITFDDNAPDVDDLATIARLAIERIDVRSLIPSPVTNFHSDCSIPFIDITGDLRLYVDNVRFASPDFDINPIPGGLHLRAEIRNVDVDLHTSGDVCEIGMGLSGSAHADRIVVVGDLSINASGGNVTAFMSSRNIQIDGLSIDLDLPGIIDWAVDGIINLFSGAISNELESAFGDVIASEVPPVIEQFLESIDLATGFNLPAPLNLRLGVDARLGSLAFNAGGGTTGEDTTIFTTGTIRPEPPGGILQETRAAPSFDNSRALGVAISYDLANQALYSLWYGGGMVFDLDQSLFPNQLPGGVQAQAAVRAMLPPLIHRSSDPSFPLELQAGDLELNVDLSGIPNFPNIMAVIHATVKATAAASIDAQGQIQLALGPNPEITLDFETPLDGIIDLVGFTQTLETTLSALLPQLVGHVLRGIPLPSFDLSSMAGNYLPPGIVLGVGQPQLRVQSSYLLLEGNVVQLP